MTRATKTICCACVVLAFLAAVTGVWSLGKLPASERDLTDAEMAGLFGRQPAPVTAPNCWFCYQAETVSNCTGTNPCGPCVQVTAANEMCATEYWWYANNNTSWTVNFENVPGYNDYIVVKNTEACKAKYECRQGNLQANKICGANGCGGFHPVADCRTCSREGGALFSWTKPWESCDTCPYP